MKILFLALFSLLAHAQDPIRIQLAGEPQTLDPWQVTDLLGFNIISNVAEGLVRLDGSGKLVPGLSQGHTISKDQKTYRFKMRPGLKWSDGQPLKPEDFVLGITRALDPKVAARDGNFLKAIDSVKAEKNELVIRLKHPDAALLQALSMPMASPARNDIFDEKGDWRATIPSAGPFRITVHKPDREIRLEPNPHHYSPGKVSILFRVIPEETTALNLFETGGLDVLTTLPNTEIPRLEKAGLVVKERSAASYYLSFNLTKPPFNELRWRKALAGLIDRVALERLQPGVRASTTYLPSALSGAGELDLAFKGEVAAVAKAEKPAATLVFPNSAVALLLLQRLQEKWRKAGWEIRLEPMEWKAYLGRLKAEASPLYFFGYGAPFDDPASHLRLFFSTDPDNRAKYRSAEYDGLFEQMQRASGESRRKAAFAAQKLLAETDAVVIPLVEREQLIGISRALQGFRMNPFGVMEMRAFHR